MNQCKRRDESIDLLKGIGMVTVVLYHSGMKGIIINYFTSFHMMLFFFVAGYCYKQRCLSEIVRRKARSLLLPYFIMSSFYTVINYFVDIRHGIRLPMESYLRNIFISSMSFGAVWFLPALFIASCLGGAIIRCCRKDSSIFVAGTLAYLFATIIHNCSVTNYLRFEQGILGISYFVWGVIAKRQISHIRNTAGIAFLIAGGVLALYNGEVIVSRMQLGTNAWVCCSSALLTILGLKWISEFWVSVKAFEKMKGWIEILGKNTMSVLCSHQLLLYIIGGVLHRVIQTQYLIAGINTSITLLIYLLIFFSRKNIQHDGFDV